MFYTMWPACSEWMRKISNLCVNWWMMLNKCSMRNAHTSVEWDIHINMSFGRINKLMIIIDFLLIFMKTYTIYHIQRIHIPTIGFVNWLMILLFVFEISFQIFVRMLSFVKNMPSFIMILRPLKDKSMFCSNKWPNN